MSRLLWQFFLILRYGSVEETLRRRPFDVFCDGRTASWDPISHTVYGIEVSHSDCIEYCPWNFEKWITQRRNCESMISSNRLIQSLNKIIDWQLLPSLGVCIMNFCRSHFRVPHFAVTHESFTIHIIYSSINVGCIAPLRIEKSNYITHFSFGGRFFR